MLLGLQFLGALGILVPFVAYQFGWTGPRSAGYLLGNLIGSVILTALAVEEAQWGFVILQAVWACFALRGLLRRDQAVTPSTHPAPEEPPAQ
ncbi:MAG: CBU_0592 family membrane protein [Sciscionella sp.]